MALCLPLSYRLQQTRKKGSLMLRECGQPKARREYPDSQQRIKKESFICVLASSIVPDPVLLRFSFSLFSSRVLICMYKTLLALLPWPVFFSFSHLIKDKDEAFLPPPPPQNPTHPTRIQVKQLQF